MSTTLNSDAVDDLETIDRLPTTSRKDHTYLGTDAKGRRHHYVGECDRMYIIHSDGDVETEPMYDRALETWAQYIAEQIGWHNLALKTIKPSDLFGGVYR